MDNFYKNHVIKLFTVPFHDIKYNDSNYSWINFKYIFISLFDKIKNTTNKNEFIKFYYIFILLYIYYTNFLKYNMAKDYNNKEIYLMINSLNNNTDILVKLIKYSNDEFVNKILKYINHFIYNKLKYFHKKCKTMTDIKIKDFVNKINKNFKTVEKFFSLENNNPKKILSIFIYRHLSSLELGFLSYHDYFIKKNIKCPLNNINKTNSYKSEHFNKFMNQIPNNKKIIDIKTNNFINRDIIPVIAVIEYLLNKYVDFYISSTDHKSIIIEEEIMSGNKKKTCKREIIETILIISHKKSNSKFVIKLNSLFCEKYFVEFNIFQSNVSLIHFNNKYINNIDFIKDSEFLIQIDVIAQNFNDPSDILDFIHYSCISFKIINNYPSDISEFINPLYFNSYYYDSFFHFISFFKNNIYSDTCVGKFIIEFVKFLYIYSYYDYFIYYKTDLVDLILSNIDKKNEIFNDFYSNFKNTLKLGPDLFPYPPFCDVDNDANRIIYYTFDIPSYFKLYDFCNAFIDVYNFNNKENITVYAILSFISNLKVNSQLHNKSNKMSHSKNAYEEIAIDKSNFVFDTDINR
jgi:hypothetical protein